MAFHIMHRFGAMDSGDSATSFERLYDELSANDDEHPDVTVEHESGWGLSAFPSGLLVWGNVESGSESWHMRSVAREKVIQLWQALADGKIDVVAAEPWQPGYGN